VERFEDFSTDIEVFLTQIRGGQGPFFLLGHSFGGQLVINYLASGPSHSVRKRLRGLILSAPNIRLAMDIPSLKVQASRLLSRLAPRLSLANEVPADFISHDPEIFLAYKRDLLGGRRMTSRRGNLLLRNLEGIMACAGRIDLPSLLLHGSEDRITSPQATREFFGKIPVEDKTLKIYEGFYHEILNEIGKERVLSDISEWILKRI
jgi:alpha-beta hydrolase superfamily lysophospholipase